ncbi:MAG: FG-GAP-like repeat-containing protein [Thermoanaerobaculia bacterium]
MRTRLAVLAVCLAAAACACAAALPENAIELRNRGFAELENEQPAPAEETFTRLAELVPDDPMPHANLAIALLRQQKFEPAQAAIERALQLAPGEPALVAIRAEVAQWSGRPDEALELMRQTAAAARDNPRLQYALYRQAGILQSDEDLATALERLARLRPDNLVVMLALGQRAIAAGDRAAASGAFLRVRELIWQAPDAAQELLEQTIAALEAGDVAAARVPALRLENVLKITPMFRGSLQELDIGIQGNPLFDFRGESGAVSFGDPLKIAFRGERLSERRGHGGLAVGDFNGDSKSDLAWLTSGAAASLRVRFGGAEPFVLPAPGLEELLAADLDNDGLLDLVGWGAERLEIFRGRGDGGFEAAGARFGIARQQTGAGGAAVLDYDIEGDLDLAIAGGRSGDEQSGVELYRNSLAGPLETVGARSLPEVDWGEVHDLVTSDLDRDGDLDLLAAHAGGLAWLDNLRQGRFALRTGGFEETAANALAAADLDGDGLPEVIAAGAGLTVWDNRGEGRFTAWRAAGALASTVELADVVAFDADNDGRLDLATAGPEILSILRQRALGGFDPVKLEEAPESGAGLAAADLDADGDLDLLVSGDAGLHRLHNQGGNANHWLSVRLRGLDKGNSKNNALGYGSVVEVRSGSAYQFREAYSDVVHFGLGARPRADLMRVLWTNGVPQNRMQPESDQWIVEEQLLKGSCPFLYAWDGERFTFVTDLLWGAPAGLPFAPGVWAPSDPHEIVLVEGAEPVEGVYKLRVTEELWEAAFFDIARLWVVDHAADLEVASSLKIVPGRVVPKVVMASRELRPVATAWDAAGREVTSRLAERDEVYADGWRRSRYQGVAAETWQLTFDLGAAPGKPIRLHLDGWIFPTDASLNLAIAQRSDLPPVATRLEVETAEGWRPLLDPMGFPAGKTKRMVVDTPPLPQGARKLRIVSNQWLSWDRIAWTLEPADDEPRVVSKLEPRLADLRFRGFSRVVRQAPNAPHTFDYAEVRSEARWLALPGSYTRYGDTRELLDEQDDRLVILAPGDELELEFDAGSLPPPPLGWRRSVFLESFGWDKDFDRNTWEGHRLEPLPFAAMSGYPFAEGEGYPDTPFHRRYREEWLTREVQPRGRWTP